MTKHVQAGVGISSTGTTHVRRLAIGAGKIEGEISGDLTCIGDPAEAAALADELRDAPFPVVAVLGNHDHHGDRPEAVAKELEAAGVHVLEGTTTMFEVRGTRVGVAGVKGFEHLSGSKKKNLDPKAHQAGQRRS